MARYQKREVLNTIVREGVVPVFYDSDADVAAEVAKVLVAGGITTLEFTNRGDGAVDVLAHLISSTARTLPELIVGVGSVVDGSTAAHVIDLGVNFVFGPSFSPAVAAACNVRNVPYVPGCGTVTEVLASYRAGCDMVKLFPAKAIGGAPFLQAMRAPCPWVQAIPTGGVDATVESLRPWFRAGAPAVGMGSKLFASGLIENRDFDGVKSMVETAVAAVAAARS